MGGDIRGHEPAGPSEVCFVQVSAIAMPEDLR
jgi:hypothetical protein